MRQTAHERQEHTIDRHRYAVLLGPGNDGDRPTEVEAITGAVVARAEEHAVPVPVNRVLLALVCGLTHSLERGGA